MSGFLEPPLPNRPLLEDPRPPEGDHGELARQIGDFRLLRELGRGGMETVYAVAGDPDFQDTRTEYAALLEMLGRGGLDPPDDEGRDYDAASVLETPTPGPTAEERLVVVEELRKMVRKVVVGRFGDDPEALEVVEYFHLGLNRREMQEWTQMPEERLAAAVRRVRRRAKSAPRESPLDLRS